MSDAISLVAQDEEYRMRRKKIKDIAAQGSNVKAGFKGLGYGIWEGVFSVPKEIIQGGTNHGIRVCSIF